MKYTLIFILLAMVHRSDIKAQSFLYQLEDSLSAAELVDVIKGAGIAEVMNAKIGMTGPRLRGKFDAMGQANHLNIDKGIAMFYDFLLITDSSYFIPPSGGYILPGLGYPKTHTSISYASVGPALYDEPDEGIPFVDSSIYRLLSNLPAPPYYNPMVSISPRRATLHFDFVPTGDSISFRYVFLSNSTIDHCWDNFHLFTAFLSGPGIDTPRNIALIPGTETFVSMNTINSGLGDGEVYVERCKAIDTAAPYAAYHVDNKILLSDHVPYAYFTTVLEANAKVNPCETYHIEITSTGQGVNPGYGFIVEAGSFKSNSANQSCEDTTTGIPAINHSNQHFAMVYPNPFTTSLQISLQGNAALSPQYKVNIIDIYGKVLYSKEGALHLINEELLHIGHQLKNGLYFINIEDSKKGIRNGVKIVKQE